MLGAIERRGMARKHSLDVGLILSDQIFPSMGIPGVVIIVITMHRLRHSSCYTAQQIRFPVAISDHMANARLRFALPLYHKRADHSEHTHPVTRVS